MPAAQATANPRSRAQAASSRANRVLPMPSSPLTWRNWTRPCSARVRAPRSWAISWRRPTKGQLVPDDAAGDGSTATGSPGDGIGSSWRKIAVSSSRTCGLGSRPSSSERERRSRRRQPSASAWLPVPTSAMAHSPQTCSFHGCARASASRSATAVACRPSARWAEWRRISASRRMARSRSRSHSTSRSVPRSVSGSPRHSSRAASSRSAAWRTTGRSVAATHGRRGFEMTASSRAARCSAASKRVRSIASGARCRA
jgi:hypothetical protein